MMALQHKVDVFVLALELFPEQEHLRVMTLWQTVSPFHVTFVHLLPALSWGGFVWFVLCVCLFVIAGSYVDAFLSRARMDMTATVQSNAALEQKQCDSIEGVLW